MKEIVINFDDVSLDNDAANGLNHVFYLKGKYSDFKLTLFLYPEDQHFPGLRSW